MTRSRFLTFFIATTAAAVTAPSPPARAQATPTTPAQSGPTNPAVAALAKCELAPPTGTMTLAEGQDKVEGSSGGTYGTKDCNAFILDVNVTSKSIGPSGSDFFLYSYAGVDFAQLPPEKCAAADIEETVSFYAMRDGAWKWIGGGPMKATGGYLPPNKKNPIDLTSCALTPQGSYKNPPLEKLPAAGKTGKYRIVVSATRNGKKIPVFAGAKHPPAGPS